MDTPGTILARLRTGAGLTQAALGLRLGLSQGQISRLEGDVAQLDLPLLDSWATQTRHPLPVVFDQVRTLAPAARRCAFPATGSAGKKGQDVRGFRKTRKNG